MPAMSLDRRHEITRLEAFSDAVFAFALTLLVVSLEVPHSYHELMTLVRGFLPFACSFALLVWIWYEHSAFFTRYALHDAGTAVINAGLLFVVLFYVYPLKYVTNAMFHQLLPEMRLEPPANATEVARLFMVYGAGYIAVFVILASLYYRAWRRRAELGLTPLEAFDARGEMGEHLVSASVGVISVAWAAFGPGRLAAFAGFLYFLMMPFQMAYGMWNGRRRRAFNADAA
jgi:uncharacterized membrane protein